MARGRLGPLGRTARATAAGRGQARHLAPAARRVCRLLVTALLALPLAGCWSRIETNEFAIIIAYGIDYHDGIYQVTAEAYSPKSAGAPGQSPIKPDQPNDILLTGTGASPGQALADVNSVSSRRVLWSSAEVVIIGQSLAERNIDPVISALSHQANLRPTVRMLIAHGDARSIFQIDEPALESTLGRMLFLMAQNVHRSESYAWAPHLFDVVRWQSEEGRAVVVPAVRGQQPDLQHAVAYTMTDSAVLQGGRLVAWLPQEDVRMAVWADGLFVHGEFEVPCPGAAGTDGEVMITHASRKVRAVRRGQSIAAFDLSLHGNGEVTQGCAGASPAQMSDATDAAVTALAQGALTWADDHSLDIFGLGETAYRQQARIWLAGYRSSWPQALSQIPVDLSVSIRIAQPGMTR